MRVPVQAVCSPTLIFATWFSCAGASAPVSAVAGPVTAVAGTALSTTGAASSAAANAEKRGRLEGYMDVDSLARGPRVLS